MGQLCTTESNIDNIKKNSTTESNNTITTKSNNEDIVRNSVHDNHNDDIKIVIKTFFKKDNCLRKCNCNVDDINCSLMLDFNQNIDKYSKNALLIQNKDDEKRNVLHYVIMSGAKQVLVLAIIDKGGRDIVNAVDSKRRNCLHYECAYTRHTHVIIAILSMNLDLAKREDINGRLPLHHLLKNGSFGDDDKLEKLNIILKAHEQGVFHQDRKRNFTPLIYGILWSKSLFIYDPKSDDELNLCKESADVSNDILTGPDSDPSFGGPTMYCHCAVVCVATCQCSRRGGCYRRCHCNCEVAANKVIEKLLKAANIRSTNQTSPDKVGYLPLHYACAANIDSKWIKKIVDMNVPSIYDVENIFKRLPIQCLFYPPDFHDLGVQFKEEGYLIRCLENFNFMYTKMMNHEVIDNKNQQRVHVLNYTDEEGKSILHHVLYLAEKLLLDLVGGGREDDVSRVIQDNLVALVKSVFQKYLHEFSSTKDYLYKLDSLLRSPMQILINFKNDNSELQKCILELVSINIHWNLKELENSHDKVQRQQCVTSITAEFLNQFRDAENKFTEWFRSMDSTIVNYSEKYDEYYKNLNISIDDWIRVLESSPPTLTSDEKIEIVTKVFAQCPFLRFKLAGIDSSLIDKEVLYYFEKCTRWFLDVFGIPDEDENNNFHAHTHKSETSVVYKVFRYVRYVRIVKEGKHRNSRVGMEIGETKLYALKCMKSEAALERETRTREKMLQNGSHFGDYLITSISENDARGEEKAILDWNRERIREFSYYYNLDIKDYPHFFLLEWANESLQQRFDNNHDFNLNSEKYEVKIKNYIKQIFSAVKFLHENEIMHGDLKPSNILFVGDTPKITDFDASVVFGEPAGVKFSSAFVPPEMLVEKGKNDKRYYVKGMKDSEPFDFPVANEDVEDDEDEEDTPIVTRDKRSFTEAVLSPRSRFPSLSSENALATLVDNSVVDIRSRQRRNSIGSNVQSNKGYGKVDTGVLSTLNCKTRDEYEDHHTQGGLLTIEGIDISLSRRSASAPMSAVDSTEQSSTRSQSSTSSFRSTSFPMPSIATAAPHSSKRSLSSLDARVLASSQFDLWSLGLICFQFGAGESLWKTKNSRDGTISTESAKELYSFQITDDLHLCKGKKFQLQKIKDKNRMLRDLVSILLERDLDRRPSSIQEIETHPYLTGASNLTRPYGFKAEFDFFISYRDDADRDVMELLVYKMERDGKTVWVDKQNIELGAKWREAFADGLLKSRIFCPIITVEAIRRCNDLSEDSRCDNLLLEFQLAFEYKSRKFLDAIKPICLGSRDEDTRIYSDFFKSNLAISKDIVVKENCIFFNEALKRQFPFSSKPSTITLKGNPLVSANMTVTEIYQELNEYQFSRSDGKVLDDILEDYLKTLDGVVEDEASKSTKEDLLNEVKLLSHKIDEQDKQIEFLRQYEEHYHYLLSKVRENKLSFSRSVSMRKPSDQNEEEEDDDDNLDTNPLYEKKNEKSND